MARPQRALVLLMVVMAPLLAGCASDGPETAEGSPTFLFLPGTSVYCVGDAPEGAVCETGDPANAFDIEVLGSPASTIRVLHERGATALDDTELILDNGRFRRLVHYETHERGPPDRTYQIGLGAHIQNLAGLLPLSLLFADQGTYEEGARDIEGAVRVETRADRVTVEARPPGIGDDHATLTLFAGDGMWPPQRMTLRVVNGTQDDTSSYYRVRASDRVIETLREQGESGIRAPSPRPWESGSQDLAVVPSLDGFDLERDFQTVLDDAEETDETVQAWTQDHPAWRLAGGSWFNVSIEVWFLHLRDACDHLEIAVRYQNGTRNVDVTEPRTDCTDPLLDPDDGPVAIADPMQLFELADHLALNDPRLLRITYVAPTEAQPGPTTADGARTAHSAEWSLHFSTIQRSSGFDWVMEHILSSDIPDSLSAVQTTRTIGPA